MASTTADATYKTYKVSKYDVFLSHDWGQGEVNHEKVKEIDDLLKKKKVKTWIDANNIYGGNLDASMASGIENSSIGLIFVTKAYLEKVAGKGRNGAKDNCLAEFGHMSRTMGPERMIPIVMETEMLDQNKWIGKLGLRLGGDLYLDMTGSPEQKIDELVNMIHTKMEKSGFKTDEQGKVEVNVEHPEPDLQQEPIYQDIPSPNISKRDEDPEDGRGEKKTPAEGNGSYCSKNRRKIIILLVVLVLFLAAAIGVIVHFTSSSSTTTPPPPPPPPANTGTRVSNPTTIVTPNLLWAPGTACDECNCTAASVDCRGLDMTSVPSGIPQLTQTLYLSDNKLTQLNPNDISYLQQLRVLDLGYNRISTLPHKLFNNFKLLDSLSMNNNQLTSLPGNMFSSLTQLTKLILSDNKFTSVSPDLFVNQHRLLYLWLDGNHLTSLPNNFLNNQHDLSVLLLDHNQLKELPQRMLKHNRKVELVHLQGNPLVCSCGLYSTLVDQVERGAQVVGMCNTIKNTVKNISTIARARRAEFC